MVSVSRLFQRFVFVLSVAIFAALGLGFALGEFGLFGVHAGTDSDGDNDASKATGATVPTPVVSKPTETMGNNVNTFA